MIGLRGILVGLLLSWALLATSGSAVAVDAIDLQLRWHHQFQFAGYYAAVEKGYYRDEGLEVRLHAGAPDRQPVGEVLAGRAQYAEGNSEVLFERLRGKPLVALAAIFQHSPSVLLVRRDSGIRSAQDLIGRKVMLMNGMGDADFITMLLNEGIPLTKVSILPSSFDVEDLLNGKADAFNSYLTNEPFYLKQRGIAYTVIDPRSYRVDFYSDILFTTEDELRNHPRRVEAVRRATLKGWRYAMDHPAEIIDLLIRKYGVQKSREHLEFEAAAMRELILPELIDIGHMNPGRWQHMADTMVRTGLVAPDYSLDGFLYTSEPRGLPPWVARLLLGSLLLILVVASVAAYFLRMSRQLEQSEGGLRAANEALAAKLREIEELHRRLQEQSIRDPVTDLFNRRFLDEMFDHELACAKRDGYPLVVAMIDLDHFKQVNDRYGHKAGDEVLKALGDLLRAQVREGDVACRYGGEEFALLLPRMPLADAGRRAEDWRASLAALAIRHGELEIRATMSVGLATYPDHGASAGELIDAADKALYRAKANGRNRVETALSI